MPFENFKEYRIVVADYEARNWIWKELSEKYIEIFDRDYISDSKEVEIRLKRMFSELIAIFEAKINEYNDAAFFIFTHINNENITKLYFDQLDGYVIDHPVIRTDDLAVDRRIYKIILERYVNVNLYHTKYIEELIAENVDIYEKNLGELLYIGNYIYILKYLIAENSFFPGCLSLFVKEDNDFFAFTTNQPFQAVLDEITNEFKRNANYVFKHKYSDQLLPLLDAEMKIETENIISFFQTVDVIGEFSYLPVDELIEIIIEKLGLKKERVLDFIDGLTISNENVLSTEDTFLRSQNINRYFYRPILKVLINNRVVYKTGNFKFTESINSIVSNSLPYGHLPQEWLKYKKIRKFMGQVQNDHDSFLEDPIEEYLKKRGIIYSRNIKSLLTNNKSANFNIDKIKGVGEIDLLFIKYTKKVLTLYVCECKNNRFRDDFYNWQRDYSNFVNSYENQLENKFLFVKEKLSMILTHFHKLYPKLIETIDLLSIIDQIVIEPIFIINAPTLYMYDGKYNVYNYDTFPDYIDENYERMTYVLTNEDTGKVTNLTYPYFRNMRKLAVYN